MKNKPFEFSNFRTQQSSTVLRDDNCRYNRFALRNRKKITKIEELMRSSTLKPSALQSTTTTVNENLKVLLHSIKAKNSSLSFNCSDLGALAGYHPYSNLTDLFMKYLYQNLDLLYELDCQQCNLEIVPLDEEITRILSKCSKEKQSLITDLTKNIIEKEQNLSSHQQVNDILAVSKELLQKEKLQVSEVSEKPSIEVLSKEEIEFLENEIFFKIKTNYGKFNEEKALNKYEEITGFDVVERNEKLFVLEIPSRVFQITEGKNVEEDQEATREVEGEIVEEQTRIQDDEDNSSSSLMKSRSSPIVCIDLSEEDNGDDQPSTVNELVVKKEIVSSTVVSSSSAVIQSQPSPVINDFFLSRTKRVHETSSTTTTTATTTTTTVHTSFSSSSSELKKRRTTKKSSYSSSSSTLNPIDFSIIGKVDGVSYQLNSSSDNSSDWKAMKIIIEVKNRVRRLSSPPPLYEQIQLIAYLIMNGCEYGDLVQVMPTDEDTNKYDSGKLNEKEKLDKENAEKNVLEKYLSISDNSKSNDNNFNNSSSKNINDGSNNNNNNRSSSNYLTSQSILRSSSFSSSSKSLDSFSYSSSNYSIIRIALQGPPYYHQYHWDTVILPRLHIFKDAIMTLRKDDDLRYSFLLGEEPERRSIIYHLCPYFD
jgi:hypothetical protein